MRQHRAYRSAWRATTAAFAVLTAIACASGTTPPAWAASGGAPKVLVLAYHRFSTSAPPDAMTVRISTFTAQLAFLRAHGYAFVPLRAVVAWVRDPGAPMPAKAVALTADDGHRSVYTGMMPIVVREHIPVTLFVYPSAISRASYALTWDELRTLRATGWFDIESHTWWHPNFKTERRRLAPGAFRRFAASQLTYPRARIAAQASGAKVDLLAWPFGIYDDELIALARQAGYIAAFTLDARPVTRGDALLALPRFLMTEADTPAEMARRFGERRVDANGRRQ